MKNYGLIGYPLSHSFSARFFAEKFRSEGITDSLYQLFPIEKIEYLPGLILENIDLFGLNVTIPYKQQVIPLLHELDDSITQIGAVNTIKIYRNNNAIRLKGYNTDVYGFRLSIEPFIKKEFTNALILGSGGASRAVAYVLEEMGLKITRVSRNPKNRDDIAYEMITPEIMGVSRVVVNTSPVGMYPDINSFPDIPYEYLTSDHVLFDLIYNPEVTKFMALGKSKGAKVINGMQMLHLQAEKAWEIWNDKNL
jgi:shikimate dehydrogenase